MFRVVLDERKKREIDPTMRLLHECIAEAEKDKDPDEYTLERLRDLNTFFESTTAWYAQSCNWPMSAVVNFREIRRQDFETGWNRQLMNNK